jgi:hypothetical protein
MKPDRFEQIVDQAVDKSMREGGYLNGPAMLRSLAASLLRRQHAAYVKIVKRYMQPYLKNDTYDRFAKDLGTDLLDAFEAYRKGTR